MRRLPVTYWVVLTGDMITSGTSGLGATTTFAYDVLTHAAVYTKGSGATYPVQDAQLPMYVVSRVNASNGVGATYSSSYSYSAARLDVQSRGFLLRGPKIASNDSDLGHWRLRSITVTVHFVLINPKLIARSLSC